MQCHGTLATGRHQVSIDEHDIVVERPYSGKPRLLIGETELPKEGSGHYLLPDEHGNAQKVHVGFDYRQLAPRLQIGARRVLTVPPLPKAAWLLLAPALLLVFAGGLLGAILAIPAVVLAAQQLRKPRGGWTNFAAAAGIVLVAVLLYLAATILLIQVLQR